MVSERPLLDLFRTPALRPDVRALRHRCDWAQVMADCPQDPVWHAEGDVWTHTERVVDALQSDEAWQALDREEAGVVLLAALLHDVGKPDTTREEDGRITSRGHSRRGAILARQLLWREGLPLEARKSVTALIRHHQKPFWLMEREDAELVMRQISWDVRPDRLALLARADAAGRITRREDDAADAVALFERFAEELGCAERPWPFPNDHTRFLYFRDPRRNPLHPAHDDPSCVMTLMSGLCGAGKDTWLAREAGTLDVVSLDAIRKELGVAPTDNQGRVLQLARERAREHLRAGRDFAWNATNLDRRRRRGPIGLAADYGARVRIVYVEAGPDRLWGQNAERPDPYPNR